MPWRRPGAATPVGRVWRREVGRGGKANTGAKRGPRINTSNLSARSNHRAPRYRNAPFPASVRPSARRAHALSRPCRRSDQSETRNGPLSRPPQAVLKRPGLAAPGCRIWHDLAKNAAWSSLQYPIALQYRLQSGAHADLLYWGRYPQFSKCLRTRPVQAEMACTGPCSTPLHTAKLPI